MFVHYQGKVSSLPKKATDPLDISSSVTQLNHLQGKRDKIPQRHVV